jgi:hypothetical protein
MCPRYYFYSHILGWKGEEPNHDLVFGQAWHAAMQYLAIHGYSDEDVTEAFDKFLDVYRPYFSVETDELYRAKNPTNTLKALGRYVEQYASDREDFDVLYTEIGGTVSLDYDRSIAFRQDTICEGERGVFSLEHKTTGGALNSRWFDQWTLKTQVGTYAHVLNCLFPDKKIDGVTINAVSLMKTKIDFQRKSIPTNLGYMQRWLQTVLFWIDMIYQDLERLDKCKESDPVLFAFPMNTENCTKYWGCRFSPFCYAWDNPLQHCYEPPVGMMVEHWDPLSQPTTTKVEDGRIVV